MQRVLFHSTIFGPIHSRRLGTSLGVNLSPTDGKTCSFDCLYCEAGFNAQGPGTTGLPPRARVARELEAKLKSMKESGQPLDVITFSGNGEPTLHPDFEGIIDDTISLRDKYFPPVKISVLSNSTRLMTPGVVRALRRVDNNILKLDSAVESTMRLIDRPTSPSFTVEKAIEGISQFRGQAIVQTMMLRGEVDGAKVDNTTPAEIDALLKAYLAVNPRSIMLYSIDRKTPCETVHRVERDELEAIADTFRQAGLTVQVN
ncbi:MAG: radical SAM protein [Firmicutes bacterium]|nr:radical SAM protein [Bacillota bacterium]MCM1401021.1 radical SAM protein [Bacteroides sp.]MCM1476940.1 radical SAM protein [Bacteroides sp.]